MRDRLLRHIIIAFLLLFPITSRGQVLDDGIDRTAEDFVQVGLIVAEPGNVLYSVLGHACLHLQCPAYGLDYFFSYESENAREKVLQFLTNRLRMGMAQFGPEEFLRVYREEGRGVWEYPLNLPPEVKSELWRICDEAVAQGMDLPYDPVARGCAISVVHCVEKAIQAANRENGTQYKIDYQEWKAPFDRTLREIFYIYAPHGWGLFWCMTLVGGVVDKPHLPNKEKLISPQLLAETWERSSIAGQPLMRDRIELLPPSALPHPQCITPLIVSIAVLLLAILSLFWGRPYIEWLLLALQTALGCLVVWMWLMPLPASGWTWLVIPFNPLPAVFWKWRKYWALPYACVLFVWCAVMAGELLWGQILVEWAHIIMALAFGIFLIRKVK